MTKHQVSGWRFLLRRIEHALVRRDTSMRDDPGRGRSTALSIGFALACVVIAGAAVLAFFKPAKTMGNARIVADKETGALYVRVDDRLHPALNLTSARLIIGSPDKPVQVSRAELAKFPRGPWVGISGAPGHIVDGADRDSSWAVCDTTPRGGAAINPRTGLPTTLGPEAPSTVIGAKLRVDGDATRMLGPDEARLVRAEGTTWLIYADTERGVVRAAIDLASAPVLMALGIATDAPVLPASRGLIDAIPEVPPIRVPELPGLGEMITFPTGLTVPVGSILTVSVPDRDASYYLVSNSGVVQVSSVLAGMIRLGDVGEKTQTGWVGPGLVAATLRPGGWPGTANFPTRPVRILDPSSLPVTCLHWARSGSEQQAVTTLVVGRRLPLSTEEQSRTVSLVTAAASRGRTADSAYLPRDTGQFVQVTGMDPASPLRESLFWISDSGVRYGIEAGDRASDLEQTLRALALQSPVPAPWSIVSLFAVGPTLSQRDARIQHDGLPPNLTATGLGGAR
ncbi:type VII secretion protein EccB [Nocardia sp. NPDC051832]|uniref:type VII secretion protein EccB n=1 Tax=Nocardia sp. NPDC051832 TaxID=3155673 RepID=UPI00343C2334